MRVFQTQRFKYVLNRSMQRVTEINKMKSNFKYNLRFYLALLKLILSDLLFGGRYWYWM